ncbi:MAG: App1 family protein [Actinomycetia bacterium]|nr:App1 family protein [Actinomycetes bacterium]
MNVVDPAIGRLRLAVAGRPRPWRSAALVNLVGGLDAAHLNRVCRDQPLIDAVVARTRDHGPREAHRRRLIEILSVERCGVLGVRARAGCLHALQAGATGLAGQAGIVRLLLATHGGALTRLKNAVDAAPDHYDLENLVFGRLPSGEAREAVLAHIAREAEHARPAHGQPREAKILSDVDDTAFARLNDAIYPKGALYPGVRAFWTALDHGPTGHTTSLGDLAFVTARPGDRFGLVENRLRAGLARRGVGPHSVLTGGLVHLLSHESMAAGKLANIERYRELFPEYALVFVGDSGQGDVDTGRAMLRRWPRDVAGVFIHDVVGTPPQRRDEYADMGIWFFDTYVGAARLAHAAGLIPYSAVGDVARSAVREFLALRGFADPGRRETAWAALDADLAVAAAAV